MEERLKHWHFWVWFKWSVTTNDASEKAEVKSNIWNHVFQEISLLSKMIFSQKSKGRSRINILFSYLVALAKTWIVWFKSISAILFFLIRAFKPCTFDIITIGVELPPYYFVYWIYDVQLSFKKIKRLERTFLSKEMCDHQQASESVQCMHSKEVNQGL